MEKIQEELKNLKEHLKISDEEKKKEGEISGKIQKKREVQFLKVIINLINQKDTRN